MKMFVDFVKNLQQDSRCTALKSLQKDQLEKKYLEGFTLYETHLFNRSTEKFKDLVIAAPFCEKYWFAYAASLQQEKKYIEAIKAWSITAILDRTTPYPHFYAAECMLSLNQKNDALKALNVAQKFCIDNPLLLQKINALIEQNK